MSLHPQVEPLFCTWIKNHIPGWEQVSQHPASSPCLQCMVVSPDEGGAKRSVMIANSLGLEFAMIHNRHKKTVATAAPTPVVTR